MEYDVLVWFANPLALGAVIAGIVAWLRTILPAIDGQWEVASVAAAVGIALGIPGDMLNLITVEPYVGMAPILGGVLYGLTGAATSFTQVNLIKYLLELGVRITMAKRG